MPKAKRERRERTDNYHLLQQWCRTPEQRLYEGIRPVVLFGIPPAERAQVRISDKFCQILKEVLPLSALAIQLNYPKTKDKFCRDSQN